VQAEAASVLTPAKPDLLPRSRATDEFNVLCYTLLSLFVIGFTVWLIFAWTGYATKYATHADGWYKGGVCSSEISLVREDRENLACASDVVVDGLHCPYRSSGEPFDEASSDDRNTLRPYHTVDGILFLGAGVWSSPALAGPLPDKRFSVVCVYRMLGAVKSVTLRWSAAGPFNRPKNTLPVGRLSDCMIPQ
jgi:hypothetical protein